MNYLLEQFLKYIKINTMSNEDSNTTPSTNYQFDLANEIKLDLDYSEDSHAQVDSNVVMTKSGKIIEFQTTAEGAPFEKSQLDEIYNLANNAIQKIIQLY